MQLLNQEKQAFTTTCNHAQKRADELARENMKLAIEVEDLKLTVGDLSTNGSSLDTEMGRLKERNRELHRQLEDLQESVDKEAEIAELRIRIGKERETGKANI
jgi:peptidoglycan hydrolase CwlO-like protein